MPWQVDSDRQHCGTAAIGPDLRCEHVWGKLLHAGKACWFTGGFVRDPLNGWNRARSNAYFPGSAMHLSQLHYLPLTPLSFSILVGIYLVLLILIQIEALRYAYTRLGVTSGAALLLLIGSLVGSYFNIPVAQLPEQRVHTLAIHPYLQEDYVEPTYFPRERHRALLGI